MIEFFRKNLFFNILLIIPYLILVRAASVVWPAKTVFNYNADGVVVQGIYHLMASPLLQSFIAILLIFTQAIIINYLTIKNRMATESTLFGGIAYCLLMSLTIPLMRLSPIVIANLFLLLALWNIINTYKRTSPVSENFGSGFFIMLAAFFHPPMIFYALWGFIALTIMHSFKWKEKLQYLSGIGIAVYLFHGFLYFFHGGNQSAIAAFKQMFGLFSFEPISLSSWMAIGVYAFIFLIVFFSYNRYSQKKRVEVQKYIDVLFWYMLFGVPTVFLTANLGVSSLAVIAPALALLIGINMSQMKNKLLLELSHLAILGVIVYCTVLS